MKLFQPPRVGNRSHPCQSRRAYHMLKAHLKCPRSEAVKKAATKRSGLTRVTIRNAWEKMLRRGKKTNPAKAGAKTDSDKIAELFEEYSDDKDNSIGPEGVEAFCNDLKLDPADRKVLLLAWKMGAARMGYFSRSEFEQGFRSLHVNSLDRLKKALVLVEDELKDSEVFQDFSEFAFKFCLTEARQKIIDIETAVQMLGLVMEDNAHLQPFVEFLQVQTDYKTINLDQWQGFCRFVEEVNGDCSNYDESQAWPLLLDNYVEWRRGFLPT